MSKSSRKGDLREREFATKFLGDVRYKLSRKGYEGPDVGGSTLRLNKLFTWFEVKSKEDLPQWLVGEGEGDKEGWLAQMRREGADAIVFRQNRKPWLLLTEIDPKDFTPEGPLT